MLKKLGNLTFATTMILLWISGNPNPVQELKEKAVIGAIGIALGLLFYALDTISKQKRFGRTIRF